MSFATTTVTAPAISFFATISCIAAPMPGSFGSSAKADSVAESARLAGRRQWFMAKRFNCFAPRPSIESRSPSPRVCPLRHGLRRQNARECRRRPWTAAGRSVVSPRSGGAPGQRQGPRPALLQARCAGPKPRPPERPATIPNPPTPSIGMCAILISAGDGAARRRGTKTGGVLSPLRAMSSARTRPPTTPGTSRRMKSGAMGRLLLIRSAC